MRFALHFDWMFKIRLLICEYHLNVGWLERYCVAECRIQ